MSNEQQNSSTTSTRDLDVPTMYRRTMLKMAKVKFDEKAAERTAINLNDRGSQTATKATQNRPLPQTPSVEEHPNVGSPLMDYAGAAPEGNVRQNESSMQSVVEMARDWLSIFVPGSSNQPIKFPLSLHQTRNKEAFLVGKYCTFAETGIVAGTGDSMSTRMCYQAFVVSFRMDEVNLMRGKIENVMRDMAEYNEGISSGKDKDNMEVLYKYNQSLSDALGKISESINNAEGHNSQSRRPKRGPFPSEVSIYKEENNFSYDKDTGVVMVRYYNAVQKEEEKHFFDNNVLKKDEIQKDISNNAQYDTTEHRNHTKQNTTVSQELFHVGEGGYYTDNKDILFCGKHKALEKSFSTNSVAYSDNYTNMEAERMIGVARSAVPRPSIFTVVPEVAHAASVPKVAHAASANAAKELPPYNTDHMVDIKYYQPDGAFVTGKFVSSGQRDNLQIREYVRDLYSLLSMDGNRENFKKSMDNVTSALNRHDEHLHNVNRGGIFGISLGSMFRAVSTSSSSGEAKEQGNTDKKKQSPSKKSSSRFF